MKLAAGLLGPGYNVKVGRGHLTHFVTDVSVYRNNRAGAGSGRLTRGPDWVCIDSAFTTAHCSNLREQCKGLVHLQIITASLGVIDCVILWGVAQSAMHISYI